MSYRSLTYDVGIMLGALKVPYIVTNVIKTITVQYVIDIFGVVVSVINPTDYGVVNEKIDTVFKDYRKIFISEKDDLDEKRYETIWALMQSGYMRWLRFQYPSQFPSLIESNNLSNLIIDERLKRWSNKPMYKFLIQDNIEAKSVGSRRLLSLDPGFFDYMP